MLEPGSEIGRYVVRRKLAEGGMAEIYLASALGPEGFAKDVVIKVVRRFLATDPQFVRMFIDEARLASRLNHANVVQIFDFGKHGDTWYLAMEYVRGASLWELRRRCREQAVPFPPTLAAEIGAQVARGLQYAHGLSDAGEALGVVHRDVTPHNVLLSFDGAVKLTDFGIAKAQRSQTQPGALKGKFAYMAPEQARGERVDARTDVFALGIVLWELVTGGRLFDGESDVAVLRAVQDSLVPPPSRLNPEVPAELSELILKALARPLEERFQSAAELEKALGTFVLRSARSVEDTSVAPFLRQLFAEEFVAEEASHAEVLAARETLGDGDTWTSPKAAAPDPSMTVTPLVAPRHLTPTRRMAGRNAGPRPAEVLPASQRKTDEELAPAGGAARPKTEQMPALRPPTSRRFDPLPPSEEASVVLSQSMRAMPELSTSDSGAAVTQSAAEDPLAASHGRGGARRLVAASALAGGLLLAGALYVGAAPAKGDEAVAGLAAKGVAAATPGRDRNEPEGAQRVALAPRPDADVPRGPDAVVTTPATTAAALEPSATPEGVTAPGAPGAAPGPTAPAPEGATPKRSPPLAARPQGSLTVHAAPFATVTIKGRRYEVTGVKQLPAPTGTYEVLLVHPRKTVTQKVSVTAGESTPIYFSID